MKDGKISGESRYPGAIYPEVMKQIQRKIHIGLRGMPRASGLIQQNQAVCFIDLQ